MTRDSALKMLAAIALFALGAVFSGAARQSTEKAEQKAKAKTIGQKAPVKQAKDGADKASVVLPPGGKKDATDKANLELPIAKIDGRPLTLGYIESILDKQSPLLRKSLEDEEKREDFIKRIVNMELLAQEAANRGFDKHEEVVSVAKNQLAAVMQRRIADTVDENEPTEEDLREYYEENITRYRKPEKVRARHILISDKKKAEKLLKELKSKEVSQHEFRRLAQENSEDEATRLRGGDLSFFTRPEDRTEGDDPVDPAVVDAAFRIEKNGDIAPILVKGEKGYHIVMRTGHRKKMDLSFEEAKDRLVTLVKREKRKTDVEEAINALKERFDTKVFEENLKYVVIDLSAGPPEPDAKGGLTKTERRLRSKNLRMGAQPIRPSKKGAEATPN